MVMPKFKNLKELEGYLTKVVYDVMTDEVTNTVKDVMVDKVNKIVYDAYKPEVYKRQYDKGGLIDKDKNISAVSAISDKGVTLTIRNIRSDNGKDVAKIVETGEGYSVPDIANRGYGKPRKFSEGTRNELGSGKAHVDAMRRGLEKRLGAGSVV